MAGGIFQIAVYGSQDIFLTSNPQVTFFKSLFRRHTNFSIEPIAQQFIGVPNFGQEMTSIIDKSGDLIHRVYLEITLPKVNLIKNQSLWKLSREKAKQDYERASHYYNLVSNYIAANTYIIRKLDILARTDNISKQDIIRIMTSPIFLESLINHRNKLIDYVKQHQHQDQALKINVHVHEFDIEFLFRGFAKRNGALITDSEFRQKLSSIINKKSLYNRMQDFYIDAQKASISTDEKYKSIIDNSYNERYKFAWVEELGHSIIDYIEIKIGSQVIDRQTGDWLILFNKLFIKEAQRENYQEMIGDVNELIIFDDHIKDSYKLLIPFQFWFCRHLGQSIPLIALRYSDVTFNIKLKELDKLCYVDDDLSSGSASASNTINDIQSKYNINIIDAQLYVDYIFLDVDERKRFAQSSHEYLIEVTQFEEFPNIIGNDYTAHINFNHPTKYVVWFVQSSLYRENPSGHNKCQWNNFGTNCDKSGQTINTAYINLNTYNRTEKNTENQYYNYVQPYLYFKHSPTDGIYVYSFAILPTEQQPSSTLNLSCIDDFSIVSNFSDQLIKLVNDTDQTIYMAVYVSSYNIIRFIGGMAGLAFRSD